MQELTVDTTLKYTKSLNILYVEDDISLQKESGEFFSLLFNSVTLADNGEDGFKKYTAENFDIVISDVKMPIMDGVELSKKIREMNSTQCIIIISAYNDSEYLQKFINLNIKQFMYKPVESENMLTVLYEVSKHIINEQMIEQYRKELEQTNKELQSKNDELQSLVRILDSKLIQISKDKKIDSNNLAFTNIKISENNLNELKELETDISGAVVLISLSNKLTVSNIEVLGNLFSSYAKILKNYADYEELTLQVGHLATTLNNTPENFIKRVENISILLESFIYVLRMWRKNIVENEIKKAFELHASMSNDINTIISIIDGTEDDIEGEMEFF